MRKTSHRSKLQAFPVTAAQVRSYQRATRNPMGVTRMAHVNGRTAASSASVRAATAGMTPAQRAAFARSVVRSKARTTPSSAPRPYRPNPVKASSLPRFVRELTPNSRAKAKRRSSTAGSVRTPGDKMAKKKRSKRPAVRRAKSKLTANKRRAAPKRKTRKVAKRRAAPKRKRSRKSAKRRAAPKRRRARKGAKRRAAPKRKRSRKSAKRRAAPKRKRSRKGAKRYTSNRKRRAAPKRKRSRKSAKRRAAPKRKAGSRTRSAARRLGKRRASGAKRKKGRYTANRRRTRRGARRGLYMTPNSAMEAFKATLVVGGLATGGFLVHRALTHLIDSQIAASGTATAGTGSDYTKELVSGGVAAAGAALSVFIGRKMGNSPSSNPGLAVAAGMVASGLQQVVVGLLSKSTSPTAQSMLPYLSGVGSYRATQLLGARGRRGRRGMRGLGNTASLMPQYAPIGAFTQAAAGMGQFTQAAAGMGQFTQAAAGMLPRSAGEYFAPNGTRGVGNYEATGELALQAAAGAAMVPIDDGIRPTANLDAVMTAMDAMAGLHGPAGVRRSRQMGELWSVTGGQPVDVKTQSEWIPQGPMWAGVATISDDQAKSELPAGIFADQGGNGVFSG